MSAVSAPQNRHTSARFCKMMRSPSTLISSSSPSRMPNTRRSSDGRTIRPSSSILRTTPVDFNGCSLCRLACWTKSRPARSLQSNVKGSDSAKRNPHVGGPQPDQPRQWIPEEGAGEKRASHGEAFQAAFTRPRHAAAGTRKRLAQNSPPPGRGFSPPPHRGSWLGGFELSSDGSVRVTPRVNVDVVALWVLVDLRDQPSIDVLDASADRSKVFGQLVADVEPHDNVSGHGARSRMD